jgi:hypothetical protein
MLAAVDPVARVTGAAAHIGVGLLACMLQQVQAPQSHHTSMLMRIMCSFMHPMPAMLHWHNALHNMWSVCKSRVAASIGSCHTVRCSRGLQCLCQGSQAPPRDFDQLVDGHWPISMGAPIDPCRGVFPRFSGSTGRNNPSFWANISISRVEEPFKISEIWGLRPQNFDPSMSLRALVCVLW